MPDDKPDDKKPARQDAVVTPAPIAASASVTDQGDK